jgi:hypothetical protein
MEKVREYFVGSGSILELIQGYYTEAKTPVKGDLAPGLSHGCGFPGTIYTGSA